MSASTSKDAGQAVRDEAFEALRQGRYDLADQLLSRGDVTLQELTHNLRVHQAELEAQAEELREVNQRLDQSAQRFKRLFEALPQPAMVVTRFGMLVQRNAAAEALFGEEGAAKARTALRHLVADDASRSQVRAALSEALLGGHARVASVRALNVDQRALPADFYVERLQGFGDEKDDLLLVLVVDETERVQEADRLAAANLALRKQQHENRRLAAVARATQAGIVMTDARRRVTWANDAFVQRSGWSLDELRARGLRMLQGPATDAAMVLYMRQCLDRGQGFGDLEIVNYAKSGQPYWLRLDVQPIVADDGQLEGWVGVQVDITARRQAAQALRDAEAWQRAVLASAPAIVATLQADGRIVSLNDAARVMLALPDGESLDGRAFVDVLEADSRAPLLALLGRVMLGETGQADVVMKARGGTSHVVELRAAPLWASRHVQAAVLVGREVSAERELAGARAAAQAALAANEAKTRFLSHMSHELRTPLNAVLGFTQLIRADLDAGLATMDGDDATSLSGRLGYVERAGWHLLSMIDDMLDLSRIEAGRIELHLERLDLVASVHEAMEMVQPLARRFGVEVVAGPMTSVTVSADRVRVKQVLSNLLSNAVKYNRPQGRVDVVLVGDADGVAVEVRDTGLGLSAEDLPRLFEPFSRLKRTSQVEGTGIGLVIAQHLAQLMQGRIDVRSTPGEGSVFALWLPTGDADDPG